MFSFAPAGYAENQQEAKKGNIRYTAGILWTALIVLIFSVLEIGKNCRYVDSGKWWSYLVWFWRKLFCGLALYLLDKERFHLRKRKRVLLMYLMFLCPCRLLETLCPWKWSETISLDGYGNSQKEYLSDETKSLFREFMAARRRHKEVLLPTSRLHWVFLRPNHSSSYWCKWFWCANGQEKPMSIYLGLTPDALITHSRLGICFSLC